MAPLFNLARPERFELPTNWFEASYSIQLSYGRVERRLYTFPGPGEVLSVFCLGALPIYLSYGLTSEQKENIMF